MGRRKISAARLKNRAIYIRMDFTRAEAVSTEVAGAIDDAFRGYVADSMQEAQMRAIREALIEAVKVIVTCAPPSPDRSAAIRKVREAGWAASCAVMHGGKY